MTRVLIVDDDEQIPAILTRVLTQHGFECRVATNADDGLEAATADPPDVVLLHVNLPTRSGLDVQRALRARSDRPAVVFVTSRRDVFAPMVDQLGPADDWILKPWDTAELVARVRVAARRARG